MSDKISVLVTGATGQQGGSVIDALLAAGHTVRGMTRNPQSDRAQVLASRGVELVSGDFRNQDSLISAMKGMDSAFLMSTSFEAGIEAETAQGLSFVDAANKAGLPFLLYTSVAGANMKTGIPHFESKWIVEERIRELGVKHAVIAPAYFYDNTVAPFSLPGLQNGAFAMGISADVMLQSISVRNIGEFAALVLSDTARFDGKRVELAGDGLTGPKYSEAIGSSSGHTIGYTAIPLEQVRQMSEDMAIMYGWFESDGYSVDIEALRRDYPSVKWETFGEWASRQDWSALMKKAS